ncbi:MAG TPA: TIGR01777 family oxidoreductase [Solirubrobacteraceae bacterium]
MSAARVTLTGATGLIGPRLVTALRARDYEVTVLTRDPDRAREKLGAVEAIHWDLMNEVAPPAALVGRDAVVHLAGEPVAQRWNASVKRAIRESRVRGTHNLIEGLTLAGQSQIGERPSVLISSSATGYYGPRGEEPLDEDAPAGTDFLAEVCVEWEREAARAQDLGMRTVQVRTGIVLDASGGALSKMLPPFRLGVGGPVAGGRQYMSWIHTEDLLGIMLAALEDERWSGPVNGTAPEPLSNRDFSRALGRVLKRPAFAPVPALPLRLLYGEMAEIITTGARVVPAKALVLGYEFLHPNLDEALRSALGS